ncbi:MAG: cytochrome c biogenesis protein CcsA [Proteobacteria bacterium]|nr:cytochrome c biogenesis protein CcsA [Pseudomonadota bacterium]
MDIEEILNVNLFERKSYRYFLPLLSYLSVVVALSFVFLIVPDEEVMGAVQRIFYFHVASAFTSYALIAVLLVASSFYLTTKKLTWDILAESAASIGLIFCSIVLVTGMIWGHSAWNTWWRWEPRLVSSLALWLLLLSYSLLRSYVTDNILYRSYSAVLAIVTAVFVPVVIFSIKIMNQNEQLHPQVLAKQGLTVSSYKYALLVSTLALLITATWLMLVKIGNLLLEYEIFQLNINLQKREG